MKQDENLQKNHDRIQQECWVYSWNKYPETRRLLFHPANELRPYKNEPKESFIRRLQYAKSIGVVSGVLDLIFYWDRLYAWDVKIGGDILSDNQKEFIRRVHARGGICYQIASRDEFIPQLEAVMSGNPIPTNILLK